MDVEILSFTLKWSFFVKTGFFITKKITVKYVVTGPGS